MDQRFLLYQRSRKLLLDLGRAMIFRRWIFMEEEKAVGYILQNYLYRLRVRAYAVILVVMQYIWHI